METNIFKTALDKGKIKEGDYFWVKYPDGRTALFRLLKTEKGYVMWGPPTTKEVLFKGKEGYDNLFTLADSQARKEYANDVFEDVHACSLPKREYKFNTYETFIDTLVEFGKMYDFSNSTVSTYVLASRCTYHSDNFDLGLFVVSSSSVGAYNLCVSAGSTIRYSGAVRPEAIPKSTIKFIEEGCNGSEAKPWICLGSQDEEETLGHGEEMHSIDKGGTDESYQGRS